MIIINKVIKVLVWLLLGYVVFALVASTLSCAFPKSLEEEEKKKIEGTIFNGDEGLLGPDGATVIETPIDALNIRLEMVKKAEKNLDIAMYKIVRSPSVDALMGEILAAANRGVKVRIIIDGTASILGGKKTDALLKAMGSHPNITSKSYNPIHLLKPWQWHFMLHDKFMVVDNQCLLLGGRNFDQRHFAPQGFTKPITYDRDVFVYNKGPFQGENPSGVSQVLTYFEELWNSGYTKNIKASSPESPKVQKELAALTEATETFEASNGQFYEKTLENYIDQCVSTYRTTLIRGAINPGKKQPLVAGQLIKLANQGQQKILFQTPYASGTQPVLRALGNMAKEKTVEMVTNSRASSPNVFAISNYYGHRPAFIETGVKLFEYQSSHSVHAKSMVVDDRWAAIGSFNLDERSIYINTESMLVFDSPGLADALTQAIEGVKSQALEVGEDNQYIEPYEVPLQPLSKGKKALLWAVYWLMRPFEFLL